MKKMFPIAVATAAFIGFFAGHATKPNPQSVLTGHLDDLSMIPSALAQDKPEVMPSASIRRTSQRSRPMRLPSPTGTSTP